MSTHQHTHPLTVNSAIIVYTAAVLSLIHTVKLDTTRIIVVYEFEFVCAFRSWQMMEFEPQPVTFIKIVGTRNTANEVFHVVHFECPATCDTIIDTQQTAAATTAPC